MHELLERLENGMRLDVQGYADLIRKCARPQQLALARRLHAHLHRRGYCGDRFLANLLTEMYGKCGSLEDAKSCFDSILHPNSYSWTMLVSAYAQTGHLREAIPVFNSMALNGFKPTDATFLITIDICCKLKSLSLARKLHEMAVSGAWTSPGGSLTQFLERT